MTNPPTPHGDGSALHRVKGRIKRFLGWLTADRRVEAEGEGEARVGERSSSSAVDAIEHEVKRGYGETLDQPPHP